MVAVAEAVSALTGRRVRVSKYLVADGQERVESLLEVRRRFAQLRLGSRPLRS